MRQAGVVSLIAEAIQFLARLHVYLPVVNGGHAKAASVEHRVRENLAAGRARLDDVKGAPAAGGFIATLLLLARLVEDRHIQFAVRIDGASVALLDPELEFPKDFSALGVDGGEVADFAGQIDGVAGKDRRAPFDGPQLRGPRPRLMRPEFLCHFSEDPTIEVFHPHVAPTALGGSIVYAPREAVYALMAIRSQYGPWVFSTYGFVDALNPTLDGEVPVPYGRVVPGVGWFDIDYLGIDQGPIVAMIENYRSELVWRTMRKNLHLIRGLRRAGFTGGWLDRAPATP